MGIELIEIGGTRIFLSNKNRLENRAIFTGNETTKELKEVTSLFDKKGVDGYFELNPANFYRTEPFSWKSEILPALLDLGYHPGDFRCVWYLEHPDDYNTVDEAAGKIRRFSCDEADQFVEAKIIVEPVQDEDLENEKNAIKHGFTKSWLNYIGYEDNIPVSISNLFIKNDFGYLAWGYTLKEYRRRSHHKLHILARSRDAFASGCKVAFSVTDFNIPSSMSLQKCGFRLAYNYLLLERRKTNR